MNERVPALFFQLDIQYIQTVLFFRQRVLIFRNLQIGRKSLISSEKKDFFFIFSNISAAG